MREEFALLLFAFGISLTINVALGIAWLRSNRRLRQVEDQLFGRETDRQTARLERDLDALAGQVEQLTNAQDFLNRVIAQRGLPDVAEPPRLNTPH